MMHPSEFKVTAHNFHHLSLLIVVRALDLRRLKIFQMALNQLKVFES